MGNVSHIIHGTNLTKITENGNWSRCTGHTVHENNSARCMSYRLINMLWFIDALQYSAPLILSEFASYLYSLFEGYIFSNDDPLLPACQQYCHLAQNFRRLQGKELDGFGGLWKYGSFHSSFIIEPSIYLKYLSAKFEAFGGRFEKRALRSLTELHGKFDVVVNCCGLGASVLTKDETMVPVRGQLVRIDAPWIKEFYMAESTTYIYPNRDTVVLGGTRQIGDSCMDVRPLETEEIVGRCQQVLPAIQVTSFS